jgi:hypothetical protein
MSSYHGKWGFDNMSHLKPVVDQASILIPFRYPPFNPNAIKLLKFILPFPYSRRQLIRAALFFIILILFVSYLLPRLFGKK